jgi:arsenate reductase
VEYWPILDPTSLGGDTREAKMAAYRQVRDQIKAKLIERFGEPQVA